MTSRSWRLEPPLAKKPMRSLQETLAILIFCFLIPKASCFVPKGWTTVDTCRRHHTAVLSAQKEPTIDLQSDETMFGRGDFHLSASLEDDDVVVYQTGSWEVDGVEVGDGTPATWQYARVENVQIVWTHNCEHGVIRGVALKPVFGKDSSPLFQVMQEQIEFGPEQLVARIPTEWNDAFDEGQALVTFDESSWN